MYKLVVMQVLSTVLIDGGSANCVLRDLFEIVWGIDNVIFVEGLNVGIDVDCWFCD